MRPLIIAAALCLGATACRTLPILPPEAAALRGHLSPQEAWELSAIQQIHAPGLGLLQRLNDSKLLADSAEWSVAGPPDVLPFAGTWHGLAGIAEFQRRLGATMRYDRVDLREYLVSGNQVAAIFVGEGVARATGAPFRSEILRLYTFDGGKIIRVRNFFDTAGYVCAVLGPACVSVAPARMPSGNARAGASAPAARVLASRADSLAQRFLAARSDRGLFAAAIAAADSATALDSTLVAAHAARAIVFSAAARPRDAALAYGRALALDPENSRIANASLGQWWRAGLYDEAYRWAKRQAEREPTNVGVLFNYNVACGFLIEPARAESLMVRALEVDPRFATAHGELAFLAQYGGRRAEAVQHMRAALSLDTTSVESRGGLAQMLVPAGGAAEAATLLAPVVARNPTATAYGGRSVLAIYGWALKESGNAAAANEVFARALARLRERERSGETTYQLFREMAAVQAISGDHANAARSLQRAADAGMHTYASWELSDPMLAAIRGDTAVQRIVAGMREDTKRMRARAGLR